MKPKTMVLMVVAVSCGLGASYMTSRLLAERGNSTDENEKVSALVARKNLDMGMLIKNPAGANEVVRTLVDGGAPRIAVVALNDAIADGRDVSWIWDVDFEPLLEGLQTVVATGERAAELALRFKYGGVDDARIVVEPSLGAAVDHGLALTPDAGELVVLPTYTAMLGLQRIVAERGLAKPYWERAA